jgi:hypothetical protein
MLSSAIPEKSLFWIADITASNNSLTLLAIGVSTDSTVGELVTFGCPFAD